LNQAVDLCSVAEQAHFALLALGGDNEHNVLPRMAHNPRCQPAH